MHASEVGLSGAPDERVFQWAQQERAIVVTFDEDFADARTYPLGSHAGVIRLRLWPTTIEQTQGALERLLTSVPDEDLPGSLVIIDRERIRVRSSAPGPDTVPYPFPLPHPSGVDEGVPSLVESWSGGSARFE